VNRFLFVLVALLLTASACTLGTADDIRANSLNATQTAIPLPTVIGATAIPVQSTLALIPLATPVLQSNQGATSLLQPNQPATQILATGQPIAGCHLRVNVGTDPGNTLRLREQANNTSTVLLLVPNNSLVTKVPGSQEINSGGYIWVNIQYVDPTGIIVTGWGAKNAMRSHDTLLPEGGC
jgi:hypothetical protein